MSFLTMTMFMKTLISNQPTSCLCWPMEGRNCSISLYLRRNTRKASVRFYLCCVKDICFLHYSILFMFDYSPPLFQIQRLMGMGQPHPLQEERHPLQEELKTKMILSHFHGSNVTRRPYLITIIGVMHREEYRSKCTNHGSNVPRSYRILRDV